MPGAVAERKLRGGEESARDGRAIRRGDLAGQRVLAQHLERGSFGLDDHHATLARPFVHAADGVAQEPKGELAIPSATGAGERCAVGFGLIAGDQADLPGAAFE